MKIRIIPKTASVAESAGPSQVRPVKIPVISHNNNFSLLMARYEVNPLSVAFRISLFSRVFTNEITAEVNHEIFHSRNF